MQAAGQELCKRGYNPGYVAKVLKAETGFGFNVQQLHTAKAAGPKEPPEQAPRSTEAAVEKEVTKEITAEALTSVRASLSTGKGIEAALGPYAKLYGYENTNLFVLELFDFWGLWHEYVNKIVEEIQLLRWGIQEMQRKLSPEALKALKAQAIKEISQSVLIMAASTGKYPDPQMFQQYIMQVKEEIENVISSSG